MKEENGLDQTTMDTAKAFEINSLIVRAWMVREQLSAGPVPDLCGVSLSDAIEASRIVAATPPERNASGGHTLTCHVEPMRIPRLYAWAITARLLVLP